MPDRFPRLGDWSGFAGLDRMVRERLPAALAAARSAPYLDARMPTGAASLLELPMLDKDDLRRAYPFGMLGVPLSRLASYHESSGTSGEPTPSFFTEADWDEVADRFNRSAVGLRAGDLVLIKTPYALVTTAHQMQRACARAGAAVVPADNRSSNMPYSKVVRLLADLPITVAWCLPTEALLWSRAARLAGLEPETGFPSLRAFCVAGEPLSPGRRARTAALWNAAVIEDYGSTETGSLAGQCPHGAMHLWADRFAIEVVDSRGRATSEGRGELVVTSLWREAMPLVRYRTGDDVTVQRLECPCGWHLPTVTVHGRIADQPRAAGRPLSAAALDDAVFSLPAELDVLLWRGVFDDAGLEIAIEVAPGAAADASALLAAEVAARCGLRPTVVTLDPGALVSHALLTAPAPFVKPRFLFRRGEDAARSLTYQGTP